MVVDDASLEEVVVMGYGTQRKINRTSSIAVSSDEKSKPSATISQTLSGQVAGLNVRTGSGQPGPAKSVNIRGIGALNRNNAPLIIVDGVPLQEI